jgi:hypothetical protein
MRDLFRGSISLAVARLPRKTSALMSRKSQNSLKYCRPFHHGRPVTRGYKIQQQRERQIVRGKGFQSAGIKI